MTTGAALMITVIAGRALLPYAFAKLIQRIGFQPAYLAIAVPDYFYILYYDATGHNTTYANHNVG
jgi:fucose permease